MAKASIAREVGQEGSRREGLEAAIRERVREVIEMVLQEEVEVALGAGRSQRVVERPGYRHGAKPQNLTLCTETIELEVPRARFVEGYGGEREWQSRLVPRYRCSSRDVEQSVLAVYWPGLNTRRIRGVAPWTPGTIHGRSTREFTSNRNFHVHFELKFGRTRQNGWLDAFTQQRRPEASGCHRPGIQATP